MGDIIQLFKGPVTDQRWEAIRRPFESQTLCDLAGVTDSAPECSRPDLVLRLARKGVPVPACEAAVGLPGGEVLRWAKGDPGGAEAQQWASMIFQAAAQYEAELTASLAQAARTSPKLAQWLLERLSPDRWAGMEEKIASARESARHEMRAELLSAGWTPPEGERPRLAEY